MSTALTWQTVSTDPKTTEAIAASIGRVLRGGETIELISDLGGGKTTFARGLVRGMGSKDKVASPTFTISKLYTAGTIEVHHFDFYRLPEPGVIADELAEVVGDPRTVAVVEWADVVQHVLPDERLTIHIQQTASGDRELSFQASKTLQYLVEAAKQPW